MTQLGLFGPGDTPEPDASTPPLRLRPAESPAPQPAPDAAPTAAPARRRPVRGRSPRQYASGIAEAVAHAWHGHFGGSRIEIPTGVVASLALLRQPENGPALTEHLLTLSPEQLIDVYRRLWAVQWISRPDLVQRALPLHAWLDEDKPDGQRLVAVHAVTQAALLDGQIELTGDPDPYGRAEADLFSFLLMELRSKGARQGLGEFHTPPRSAT